MTNTNPNTNLYQDLKRQVDNQYHCNVDRPNNLDDAIALVKMLEYRR